MKPINRDRFKISEEAAQWLLRLEKDNSPECQAQFTAWSRQSPQHVEEFLFATATWQHLQPVDPQRRIDLDRLEVSGDADAVVPIGEHGAGAVPAAAAQAAPTPVSRVEPRRLRRGGRAAAAVFVAAAGAFYWFSTSSGNHTYTTATGDQMAVKLPDGSVLYLNTHSKAKVSFDDRARKVMLLEGEALFVVERDVSRPFQVIAAGATIQALGTQFNVYRRDDGTRVSVVDGAVRVTSEKAQGEQALKLDAGDEANVTAGQVVRTARPNVQRAVAWRARRLVFQSDRLSDVAREFNRYETRHPIRLEGEAIENRVVSGVFDADDPDPLIDFLKEDPELEVAETAKEIVIRRR